MKKAIIILSMLLCIPAFVCCEKDHIEKVDDVCTKMEDINFKQYCYDNFDVNKDGKVSMDEANSVFEIDVMELNIYSLKGIEYFSELKVLLCTYNNITALDISRNMQLMELACADNRLSSLDISRNTKLIRLACGYNQITSLDISNNTQLVRLHCSYDQLSSLDVTNNTQLYELYCDYNSLTTLDVSKNTQLEILVCYDNQLTSLDLSNNPNLSTCRYNPQRNGNITPTGYPN